MELDWLAVVIATVVGMAVAGAWYGKVFTTLWSTLTGVAAEDSAQASRRNMALLLVANGATAVGLAGAAAAGVATVSAAAGAVAGAILPVIGPVVGGLAGAGIMLYKRLRP